MFHFSKKDLLVILLISSLIGHIAWIVTAQPIFWGTCFISTILLFALHSIVSFIQNAHFTLYSEAGEQLGDTTKVWTMYPRPQLKRNNWTCLNGTWTLNDILIRVPFPPESILSGYTKHVKNPMIYTKTFLVEKSACTMHTLLHFEAVDQIAEVFLNGTFLGKHEGGYLPFTFDISHCIHYDKENTLVVKAIDTLSKDYPYGKQTKNRGGMWYTPVSGIWKSVWLEQVPTTYITDIKITPDLHGIHLAISTNQPVSSPISIQIQLHTGEVFSHILKTPNEYIPLRGIITKQGIPYEPILWTTEQPYLYTMMITLEEDTVETYFALRTITLQEIQGIERVCLNEKPIFLHGILDQGYFCDGIFLPANEQEFERDVLRMKELGFNLLRKHIKIEPECFYYYCDLHGMLVMQDMVNSGPYSFLRDTALPTIGMKKWNDTHRFFSKKQKQVWETHMKETLSHLYNHPSIIAYTLFNEGWGQFDSDNMYDIAKAYDSSRLYDSTSGWFAQQKNDFDSRHVYFGNLEPQPDKKPLLISEFGGSAYSVPNHHYTKYASYGYGSCKNADDVTKKVWEAYRRTILPVIEKGACGSIYTQLSDVEDEVNGLYTYDRKVCKVNIEEMKRLRQEIDTIMKRIL